MGVDIKKVVDRMIGIKNEEKELAKEYALLQAQLQMIGESALENTKQKSVSYYGDSGRVTVTLADKVQSILPSLYTDIFGKACPDLVTTKEVTELTAEGKRIAAAIWNEEYCEGSVEDIVSKLDCDDKAKKSLLKKLQGKNYETDRSNLMRLGGLDEESAGDYAYMVAEVIAWNKIKAIIRLNNDGEFSKTAFEDMKQKCCAAICVEQSTKLTVEELTA